MALTQAQENFAAAYVGEFDKLCDIDRELVMKIVANFHFRDGKRYDDGSMGTIYISPKQLNDCIAHAMRVAYSRV